MSKPKYRDSEKEVKSILDREAKRYGFREVALDESLTAIFEFLGNTFHTRTFYRDGKMVPDSKVYLTLSFFDRLRDTYNVMPEHIYGPIRFGMKHERTESSEYGNELVRRQCEREIMMLIGAWYNSPQLVRRECIRELRENDHMPEVESEYEFIKRINDDPKCKRERESQINLKTVAERLNEPGMTIEKLKEELAASLWLIYGEWDEIKYLRDVFGKDIVSFPKDLDENFPWLKGIMKLEKIGESEYWTLKGELVERAKEMDREYRNALERKAGRRTSEKQIASKWHEKYSIDPYSGAIVMLDL